MIIDLARNSQAAAATQSDVCIIGAGAAGISLARRLAGSGHSVTLCESGGTDFEAATQQLYDGRNVGMPYYDLEVLEIVIRHADVAASKSVPPDSQQRR